VGEEYHALIPAEAYDALVDAGVTVAAEVQGDRQVDVRIDVPGEGSPTRTLLLQVKRYSRPLTPGAVAAAADRRSRPAGTGQPGHGLLLITPSATEETARHAAELGISLIALNRGTREGVHGHLIIAPGDVMPLGHALVPPAPEGRRTGVPARGELQIVKTLLLPGGRTQKEIAGWASVSQPRVSQVLKRLAQRGLVRSSVEDPPAGTGSESPVPRRTWTVVDWDRLLRHWMAGYPGPGGVTTYWYGLGPPARQVAAALSVLGGAGTDHRLLVSGDVAADLIAPWARPAHAILYTEAGADLSAAGLTPAPAAESTLALTVPEETGLWRFADHWWQVVRRDPAPGGLPLADPLQVLHDVRRSPSVDADQAIEVLSSRIHQLHLTARTNLETDVRARRPETNR
jgi:hypothetical protein